MRLVVCLYVNFFIFVCCTWRLNTEPVYYGNAGDANEGSLSGQLGSVKGRKQGNYNVKNCTYEVMY